MVHWDLRTQCRCAGLVVPGGSAPGATDHQGTRAVSKEAPEEAPSCGSLTATQRRSPGALAGGQLLLHEPLCGPAWRRGWGPAGAGASAEGRGRQVLVLRFLPAQEDGGYCLAEVITPILGQASPTHWLVSGLPNPQGSCILPCRPHRPPFFSGGGQSGQGGGEQHGSSLGFVGTPGLREAGLLLSVGTGVTGVTQRIPADKPALYQLRWG